VRGTRDFKGHKGGGDAWRLTLDAVQVGMALEFGRGQGPGMRVRLGAAGCGGKVNLKVVRVGWRRHKHKATHTRIVA
jgi:hypothetical protein